MLPRPCHVDADDHRVWPSPGQRRRLCSSQGDPGVQFSRCSSEIPCSPFPLMPFYTVTWYETADAKVLGDTVLSKFAPSYSAMTLDSSPPPLHALGTSTFCLFLGHEYAVKAEHSHHEGVFCCAASPRGPSRVIPCRRLDASVCGE